jgi:CHAT domain-containing protein
MRGSLRRVAGAAAVALALAAAAARADTPPPPSGDQAAPPRGIADITAILDREKPDPARVAAARAAADAQPPIGLAGADLATFYFKRGLAANRIGRQEQERADLGKALAILRPLQRPEQLAHMLGPAAEAELRAGDPGAARALRVEEAALAEQLPRQGGHAVRVYAVLAMQDARVGRLKEAAGWLAKAEARRDRIKAGGQGAAVLDWFILRSQGEVLDYSGRHGKAEPLLRQALAGAEATLRDPDGIPPGLSREAIESGREFLMRDLALCLARQARPVEGEVMLRRALLSALHREGHYAPDTAILLSALGGIIAEQGRFADAERLQRAALDIYLALGDAPASTTVVAARLQVSTALVAQQRWAEALGQYDKVAAALASDPKTLRRLSNRNLGVAVAALRGGRPQLALEIARAAAEGRGRVLGPKSYATAEARGFLGAALAASGDPAGAMSAFQAAVPVLLSTSREAEDEDSESGRQLRLQFVLEAYLDLLAGHAAGDPAALAESFRIADAARGRAVQRAMAAALARAAVPDPALADLVRREQDDRKQLAALYARLADALALPTDQGGGPQPELTAEIDRLRTEHAALRGEIERRFPDYVNLIDPRPSTLDQVRQALHPGEALIATYVGEARTYVWAVPKVGTAAFVAAPLSRAALAADVAALRRALDPDADTLAGIPAFDVDLAARLYQALLAPVAAAWNQAHTLLVVPHGPLGQLPLSLLVTQPATLVPERQGEALFTRYRQVAWLARKAAIMQLPSVAALASLRAAPPAPAGRKPFIGFGDPWFNAAEAAEARQEAAATPVVELALRGGRIARRSVPPEGEGSAGLAILPRLPETAGEVEAAAAVLKANPAADVFLGARASEAQLTKLRLDDRRVVMFATHGLVPGDLDGLAEPALALTAPALADAKGGDGLLTMHKILGLRLNADWVVLSACNSAAGNGAGAEAVSGLGLAFFYAGTRAVLATEWPVETSSARALTTALFRHDAEDPAAGRAEALRRAMLDLIDGPGAVDPSTGRAAFSYAHPIFWAAFALIGEGGAGPAGN